jgi:hypothetical protein
VWILRGQIALLVIALSLVVIAPARGQRQPDRQVAGFDIFVEAGFPGGYDDIWAALPERMARVRRDLGDDVLTGGSIFVVRDLNGFFQSQGEVTRVPDWAKAVALPSRRWIVWRVPDTQAMATLTHELSHLAVEEAAGGEHVPRWFMEGFAVYQAEEWGFDRWVTLMQASLFGNTLSFAGLDRRFPGHNALASLAYAQSFHFVRWLIDERGTAAIQTWLTAIAGGMPWEQAFLEAFAMSPQRAFGLWEDEVQVWYAWIPAAVSVATLWAGAAVLVAVAFRRVRRRRAARLSAMKAQEAELYGADPDDELFR